MTPERWRQIKNILNAAMEQPAGERTLFLEQACASDAELRNEVDSLLAASDSAGEFLNEPIMEQDPIAGSKAGQYRLLEPVGRGGMGAVYRAVRDDDQFQQEVAIKVVKRGMDTDAVLARFRYERQILAFLTHPNIARLHDGGATDDGRPYLVMEFIEGLPITEYCKQNRLSVNERLRLFLKACAAVEYAHRNMIVHRDLKPGNILINKDGEPKLLDFGIAKILLPAAAGIDESQTMAVMMLTPEYASPEQVKGGPVNTLTDIYSMGIILYEILTGRKAVTVDTASQAEIERVVCEQSPPRPSEAALEHGRELQGDLDNIVLKAMHKDAMRRYSSVEQFSEDIRRYLNGLPVAAREDTLVYRTRKFIQRHTFGFAATILLLLVLTLGAAATAWQAREARLERDRATRLFNMVRQLANAFLIEHDALASIPNGTGLREKLIAESLKYLDSLAAEANDDPGLQRELAAAYEKMGDVQGRPDGPNLGDSAAALMSYQKAVRIRERLAPGRDDADLARLAAAYARLSSVLKVTGDFQAGLGYDRKALDIREQLFEKTPGDLELKRELAASHTTFGGSLFQVADWKGVLEHRRAALSLMREIVRDSEPTAADFRAYALAALRMGSILVRSGDAAQGLRHYEEALRATADGIAKFPKYPQLRMTRATTLNARGRIRLNEGHWEEALADYRAARAMYSELRTADPKDFRAASMLAGTHHRIAQALTRGGRPAAALVEIRTALSMREDLATRDPANTGARGEVAESKAVLGDVRLALGNRRGAIREYKDAVELLSALEAKRQANPEMLAELQRVREALAGLGVRP